MKRNGFNGAVRSVNRIGDSVRGKRVKGDGSVTCG
jgi:hypothetical protein